MPGKEFYKTYEQCRLLVYLGRALIALAVFGLAIDSGRASQTDVRPFCEMDLNDDGRRERLYQISNVFVGDANHFQEGSKYLNKLYIEDGATGEVSVFQFSGIDFQAVVSRAEKGDIFPFHDAHPAILIYVNGELQGFIHYNREEKAYSKYQVKIREVEPENVPAELKGRNLVPFLSQYKGNERIFPFHYRGAKVRAFSIDNELKYFMYSAPQAPKVTKWYSIDYIP